MNESRRIEVRPLHDNEIDNGDPRLIIHPYFSQDMFVRVDRFINVLGRQFPIDRILSVRQTWPSNSDRGILKGFEILSSIFRIIVYVAILLAVFTIFVPLQNTEAREIVDWIPYPHFLEMRHVLITSRDLGVAPKFVFIALVCLFLLMAVRCLRTFYALSFRPGHIEVMLNDGHIERFRCEYEGRTDGNYSIFGWAHNYMSGSAFQSDCVPVICGGYPGVFNSEEIKSGWPNFNPAQLLQLNITSTRLGIHLTSVRPLRFGRYFWLEAVVLGNHGVEITRGNAISPEEVKNTILTLFERLSGTHGLTFINGHGEHFLKSDIETVKRILSLRGSRPNSND